MFRFCLNRMTKGMKQVCFFWTLKYEFVTEIVTRFCINVWVLKFGFTPFAIVTFGLVIVVVTKSPENISRE